MRLKSGRFSKITELYAFICKDEKGEEGILGAKTPDGAWMPLIGADLERVKYYKPLADTISKTSKMPYEIRYFVQKNLN